MTGSGREPRGHERQSHPVASAELARLLAGFVTDMRLWST